MKPVGSAIDWLDNNIDRPAVMGTAVIVFVVLMLICLTLLVTLPSHDEYCADAIDNPTCTQQTAPKVSNAKGTPA